MLSHSDQSNQTKRLENRQKRLVQNMVGTQKVKLSTFSFSNKLGSIIAHPLSCYPTFSACWISLASSAHPQIPCWMSQQAFLPAKATKQSYSKYYICYGTRYLRDNWFHAVYWSKQAFAVRSKNASCLSSVVLSLSPPAD